jgi:hypothetical protein
MQKKTANSESLAAIFFAFLFELNYLAESAAALSTGVATESAALSATTVESVV